MRTLVESRALRYLTFAALYFAQGIPWGFISVGYVVYLTDLGFDNTAVGSALGLAYVPWSFKIVWGPLIDRFPSIRFGRRRHFIIAAELCMGLTMLGLLLLDPRHQPGLMGAVLFLHNTFASMQDVATDALAVDTLPEHERGGANSVMWAAKSAGIAAGGGAGTVIAKHFGWPTLFVLVAILIWLVMALVIAIRERPAGAASEAAAEERLDLRTLWRSFAFKTALVGIAIAMITPAYGLIGAVFTRLLRADLHLSEEAIGTLQGVADPIAGVVGALVGGFLADRLGMRKVIAGFMALIALSLGVFALGRSHWGSMSFLLGWVVIQAFVVAAYNAASLGFFMTLSNPKVGATQFAVFMAATNLTYAWTSPTGGWVADHFGLASAFGIAAVVQLLSIGLLPLCNPHDAEARFRGL
jgi:MFS transporter, PAT family, beta-lactamase induction signal transducer AmpG